MDFMIYFVAFSPLCLDYSVALTCRHAEGPITKPWHQNWRLNVLLLCNAVPPYT